MEQSRRGNSAEGRDEGEKGALGAGQFAALQLAFEFQADEKEEDRHERIVYPMLEAETSDPCVPPAQIGCTARRIRDEQRDAGADNQQNPARLLRVDKGLEGLRQV